MIKRQNSTSKFIVFIGVFLSFLVTFIVIYAPVLQTGFLYGTDYPFFGVDRQPDELYIVGTLRQGRIIEGLYYLLFLDYIQSSESTIILRLVSIIGIALFAAVIYTVFKRCRFRTDHAFLISASICTLPSFQILASWAIVSPYIYSAFLSSLSALLLFNTGFKEEGEGRAYSISGILTAIILLIIALNINQPPAMMYWAMGVIFFLDRDNGDFSNKVCRSNIVKFFFVGLISILIYYFVFIKIIPFLMNFPIDRGATIPIRHIPSRVIWFISLPFKNAINLWNYYPTYKFATFISLTIFLGIISDLLQERKKKKTKFSNYSQKYFLILCMIILTYLPNLVVLETTYFYRTIIALSVAISILFYFAIINIVDFFGFAPNFSVEVRKTVITILLTILTIITALMGHNKVYDYAVLHSSELKYVKNAIVDYGESNLFKIYMRRPRPMKQLNPGNELELKLSSTSAQNAQFVIKQAMHEIGIKQDIQIIQGAADDPIPEDDDILIIDMTKFQLNINKFMQD